MKKIILGMLLASLMSLPTRAAPPAFYTALTNGLPFVDLIAQSGADLVSITNTDIFPGPGAFGFEVDVVYPDGSDDTWYFVTELVPTGQILVTLLPEGPVFEDLDTMKKASTAR